MKDNQTSRNTVIAAAIIGCSLIIAAIVLGKASGVFAAQNRYVSVKGLCEEEFAADRVVWPIPYKVTGNNLSEISAIADKKSNIIQQYLLENGLTKEELSTSVPKIEDLEADRYSYRDEKIPYRYLMTNVITITSNKVDLVRELMTDQGELLRKGIAIVGDSYQYSPEFQYAKFNDVKVDMIEKASANAKASAQQFARDSDSKLGKIKQASQGQISIYSRDDNSPHIKRIRVVTSITYFLKD